MFRNPIELTAKVILTLAILGLGYYLYETIMEPIRFERERDQRYEHVIDRLKVIRSVQLAYRGEHGKYTEEWDELLRFAKEDSISIVTTYGNPDADPDDVRHDTQYVKVRDSLFRDDYPIDSLPYVPFSEKGARFEMKAGSITRGGVQVPTFEVKDTDPFDEEHILQVGSLTESTTSGNWE